MPSSAKLCVLFDLDGVLLDTEPLYTEAIQAVVGRFGKTYDWGLKRHTMGRDARYSTGFIIEQLGIPLTTDQFLTERAPILEALFERSPAMPGVESFVRMLEREGVHMAVATSSDRRYFEMKTRAHSFFDAFRAVVCGDDPRVGAKKPAPDIFLVAARELGADPRTTVVIEDSPAGVEAAVAAGMRVVAIPDAAMSTDHYTGAHRIVRSYESLSFAALCET